MASRNCSLIFVYAIRGRSDKYRNWVLWVSRRQKMDNWIISSNIYRRTPSNGRAKTGRPARTYIQQLCADTGYSLENLLGTVDDRDGWQERVKDIHATWWWIKAFCNHCIFSRDFVYTLSSSGRSAMSTDEQINLKFWGRSGLTLWQTFETSHVHLTLRWDSNMYNYFESQRTWE